jgi:peptidoglycan/LPS O-acetylase OafA/YrhL
VPLIALSFTIPLLYIVAQYYLEFVAWFGIDTAGAQFGYGNYLARYSCMFLVGIAAFEMATVDNLRILARWPFDVIVLVGLSWIFDAVYQGRPFEISFATAVLVVGLYREGPVARALMGNPVAVFFGDISYALYLSHIIVLSVLLFIARKAGVNFVDLNLLLTVAVAVAVVTALHYGFERPARSLLRKRTIRIRPTRQQALTAGTQRLTLWFRDSLSFGAQAKSRSVDQITFDYLEFHFLHRYCDHYSIPVGRMHVEEQGIVQPMMLHVSGKRAGGYRSCHGVTPRR